VKVRLSKRSHAGRNPHACGVDILVSVVVEVQPACAHAGSGLIHPCFFRNRSECPVAIAAVEIVTAKVVHHVQVRPAVRVEVAPGTGEAVTIVVDIQAGSFRPVLKDAVAFIVEQKVWRSIARVKIGDGIVILVQAEIVGVEAEINVEPSIAIVVGDGGVRECPWGGCANLKASA